MSGLAVVYIADQQYASDLQFSVASWRRFVTFPITVIDLGLSAESRRQIDDRFGGISWLPFDGSAEWPNKRDYAYLLKSRLGDLVRGEPVLFLDADIVVLAPSFFDAMGAVDEGEMLVSHSAWDRDFTWTYQADALPALREISGIEELDLSFEIPNSGVWAMRSRTAAAISSLWNTMLSRALASATVLRNLNPGTRVGDQEFLVLAARQAEVKWRRLHGSHNMQVHESRMPWIENGRSVLGGHHGEPPEPVRAVHYRFTPNAWIEIDETYIRSDYIRTWLQRHYAEIGEIAFG
jgi:hypothetical protein